MKAATRNVMLIDGCRIIGGPSETIILECCECGKILNDKPRYTVWLTDALIKALSHKCER